MDIFASGSLTNFGALSTPGMISLPEIPNILSEWFSIVPLVCHLASHRDDYIIAGQAALLGRLSTGFFPKLGTLLSLARLVSWGPEFLDQATPKSGSMQTVWDVNWGSVFPAANGAACIAIVHHIRKHGLTNAIKMPENFRRQTEEHPGSAPISRTATESTNSSERPLVGKFPVAEEVHCTAADARFRRYQTLHVLQFGRQTSLSQQKPQIGRYEVVISRVFQYCCLACLAGVSILLCLCGCYGTAAIVWSGAISRLTLQKIQVERPLGYLENNENHDACMLLAPHQNAVEWYLFVGDRAIIDTLLNKAMLGIKPSYKTATWLRFAHILQLVAMTYTAGQKGWDGVCLLSLLLVDRAARWGYRDNALAADWLAREGIKVGHRTFNFSGRAQMLGTIQLYSESKITSWMDGIMVPHPRRDAWLQHMQTGSTVPSMFQDCDIEWIERTAALSSAATNLLRKEMKSALTD